MPRGRKRGEDRFVPEPTWIGPFLDALGVTGNVGASAQIAGIDVTGVYRRKTRNKDFREQWAAVLSAREARASGVVAAPVALPAGEDGSAGGISVAGGPAGEISPGGMSVSGGSAGGGAVGGGAGGVIAAAAAMGLTPRMTASGVKLARVGTRRWSAKPEAQFLAAIANCANMAAAAASVGFSKAAVSKRRLKDPRFAMRWDMAMEVGQVRIRAGLIAQAARAFDSDDLPLEGEVVLPPMSNAERMAVAKMSLGRKQGTWTGVGPDPFIAQAAAMTEGEQEDLTDRLLEKLWRTRKLIMKERRAKGGIEVGRLVLPPGFVWQGDGPMPLLPGQDDDQGWDALPARLAAGEARRRAAGRDG